MPIDTTVRFSPGWWMDRLSRRLTAARPRLDELDLWYRGKPPTLSRDPNQEKWADVTRQSETNLAALAVDARRDRMQMRAVRTSVDGDLEGDEIAWSLIRACDLDVELATLWRFQLSMGRGLVAVGIDTELRQPFATVEDPRDVIVASDPLRPAFPRAAFKIEHDADLEEDRAWLWLPGERHLAVRTSAPAPAAPIGSPRGSDGRPVFVPGAFDFVGEPETFDKEIGVPVVEIATEDGEGIFAKHLGILERVNRGTFRRDTIALMQAFRQRAVVGNLDDAEAEDDRDPSAVAKKPDWNDILSADPGALWNLPEGVQLWESGQVDLSPLQASHRDDVKEFAAVTRTPLSMVDPANAAQSAEGASLQREGLVFAVEDLRRRSGGRLARVVSLLLTMGGEPERGKLDGIVVEWMPTERFSLGERGAAAIAAQSSGVPWRTRMSAIWGFDDDAIRRMESERLEDLLYAGDIGSTTPAAPASGQAVAQTSPGETAAGQPGAGQSAADSAAA